MPIEPDRAPDSWRPEKILVGFDGSPGAHDAVGTDTPSGVTSSRGRSRSLRRDAPAAIAEACAGTDLLVSGSRGYGAFSRVMIGSVSTALIHTAPCPVLIVPRPAAKARRASSDAPEEAPQPSL